MGKKYVVESDFEDLHGNPDDAPELELDMSDAENPIIKAALSGEDEDWKPPEDDDQDDSDDSEDEDEDDDDDDLDEDSDEDEDDEDEDDGDEDDDEEDEDDDEDDEKYSKKVQKRIDRERDLRLQEKKDSDRRFAKLEKQIKLRDAKDEFITAKQDANKQLAKLRKKKIAALDEGETSTVVDIDDEILDIKADLKAKELELDQTEKAVDNDDTEDMGASKTPAEGRKFLEKYPQFHTNSQFRNVVLSTDKSVAARGFDKDSPEYYAEMEDILRLQFPAIIKKKAVKVRRKGKKKRSAVGSTTKAGTRRTSKKTTRRRGRIRLTKTDQEQMAIFGLDPTNPVDAKAWAENKGA